MRRSDLLWLFACAAAVGCGSSPEVDLDGPWWEAANGGCPEGTSLRGKPPPEALIQQPVPPEEHSWAFAIDPFLACRAEGDAPDQGPFTAWWSNGARKSVGRRVDGFRVDFRSWDAHGRRLITRACPDEDGVPERCIDTLTLWHADGSRAVEGTLYSDRHGRQGVWREWDEQGGLVGEIAFRDGEVERVVDDSLFLRHADFGEAMWPEYGDRQRDLPVSSATPLAGLQVTLEATRSGILVDSVPVLPFEAGRVPDDERKGALIAKLYDRLVEKQQFATRLLSPQPPPGSYSLNLALDPALRMETVFLLLYTAGQAQFDDLRLLTHHPDTQLPPRTGPVALQGARTEHAIPIQLPAIGASDAAEPVHPVVIVSALSIRAHIPGPASTGAEELEGEDAVAALRAYKQAHPGERRLVIAAAEDVVVQRLVEVLDSLREDADGEPLFDEPVVARRRVAELDDIAELKEKSLLLKMLTTRSEHGIGTAEDAFRASEASPHPVGPSPPDPHPAPAKP